MNNKLKGIDTKNCTYYFFDEMVNVKDFDPNIIKLDNQYYKNFLIYYIGYMTVK